jgi:tRNA(Ile)-lysidine synthase
MNLLQRFQQYVIDHRLFSPKDTLLLAVSGGLDSVVLCELCKQAGYRFAIAHYNFKLRGEESDRDEAFVQQLALTYAVPFWFNRTDTQRYADSQKLSIQEAARELRYSWFKQLLNAGYVEGDSVIRVGTCVVTAHHLDDNIETMLMHFFRGTGIHGLRGMLPKKGPIVRPLLFARKQELKEFAVEHQLSWVEDSSNALDKYSRNYFRNQIIPFVQNIYPEAENNLAANLRRFADMELLYEQAVNLHKKKLLEYKGQEVHIPVLKLQKSEPLHSIVYEIINDFGFSAARVEEVIRLLESESGRYVASATHRIIKNRRWLIIAPVQADHAQTLPIDEDETRIVFENGALVFSPLQNKNIQLSNDPATAFIDHASLQFPLLLRKWKKGDYFYPLGLKKKKKIARFLIDQKLSLTDKEKVWVLESNKKICWVVGLRIDDRFKITDATKQIFKIQLIK